MESTLVITWTPIEEVIPYIRNAKSHPDSQIVELAESIKRYGWTMPILTDGEKVISAGHGRYLAAKLLGLKKVPLNIRADLSEVDHAAYRLVDNRLADTPLDPEVLRFELASLQRNGVDPELAGFRVPNIQHFIDHGKLVEGLFDRPRTTTKFDEPKEKKEKGSTNEKVIAIVKKGDLWKVGPYTFGSEDSSPMATKLLRCLCELSGHDAMMKDGTLFSDLLEAQYGEDSDNR